ATSGAMIGKEAHEDLGPGEQGVDDERLVEEARRADRDEDGAGEGGEAEPSVGVDGAGGRSRALDDKGRGRQRAAALVEDLDGRRERRHGVRRGGGRRGAFAGGRLLAAREGQQPGRERPPEPPPPALGLRWLHRARIRWRGRAGYPGLSALAITRASVAPGL